MSGHVVVAGSLNMDLVVRAPRHPRPGETILGGEFATFPGGKGANQAVAAARLGARVTMIGCVGADEFGESLLATLTQDGVNTDHVRRDSGAATGVALITVDHAGQNTIVVASGANARLSPADVDAAEGVIAGASVLLLQLESPLPTVARAIEVAARHHVRVVLNPAPAQPLDGALLAGVDYLIPNQSELSLLAGMDAEGDPSPAVRRLQERGARAVIVTLGGAGAAVFADGRETRLPAFPVRVVDTTAAGDAFVGGFAVALAEGRSPAEAANWGSAAGALAVTRPGAQPSLPRRAELEAFMLEHARRTAQEGL